MKITSRKTHAFTEISVDEIETNVYKSDKQEADEMVRNLLSVIEDIVEYTGNDIEYYFNDYKK